MRILYRISDFGNQDNDFTRMVRALGVVERVIQVKCSASFPCALLVKLSYDALYSGLLELM